MILRCPHCPACANGPMHDLWVESAQLVRLWLLWNEAAKKVMPYPQYRVVDAQMHRIEAAIKAVPKLERKK